MIVVLFLVGFISLGRTLDNSVTLIEHIFKPISVGKVTIYYGLFFSAIAIFNAIKMWMGILKAKKNKFLKAFILTIIALNVFVSIWDYGIKLYIESKNELGAVYGLNETANIFYMPSTNTFNVNFELENLGEKPVIFRVKVYFPDQWDKFLDTDSIELPKEYILNGNERMEISEQIEYLSGDVILNTYQYIPELKIELFNETPDKRILKHTY